MPRPKNPRTGNEKSKITKPKPSKSNKATPRRRISTSNAKRSRLTSPTPSASESDRMAQTDDNDDDDDDEDTEESNAAEEDEPDFILAEISHPDPSKDLSSSETTIPSALLHRIIAEFWRNQDDDSDDDDDDDDDDTVDRLGKKKKKKKKKGLGKTKISKDALEVFRMYIEVFVREGIKRCEIDAKINGGSGWVEVDGLERVAVQLCLDF